MDTLFPCFSFRLISRTVPGNVQIRGEADTDAIVTVNENPTWRYPGLSGSAAQTSPRSGATSAQPQLRVLREGARAIGTNQLVGFGNGLLYYGYSAGENGSFSWNQMTQDWVNAPVWNTYHATW